MSSTELPEEAAKLLKNIRKNYKVGFEKFSVRDISLDILSISDLEPVLKGKDPFKDVSSFPFWVKLWESAMVLADVAATLNPENGPRLLELGAGLGVPGLVAARRGFDVTLSDYEKLPKDFQRISAAANKIKVAIQHLDWTKPPEIEKFDVILGAEILYKNDVPKPLLKVMGKMIKPGGAIYLAHDQRRKTLYEFLDLAKEEYKILVKEIKFPTDEGHVTIMLNCLKPL